MGIDLRGGRGGGLPAPIFSPSLRPGGAPRPVARARWISCTGCGREACPPWSHWGSLPGVKGGASGSSPPPGSLSCLTAEEREKERCITALSSAHKHAVPSREKLGMGNGNPPQYSWGKFHGQRSLEGYSPWGRRVRETHIHHTHTRFPPGRTHMQKGHVGG